MILNNKKEKVFGVVERAEENKDYTGASTETATVSVNNTTRQISVDVKFNSMLGETSQKAYPGHQGKINRDYILQLQDDLKQEVDRSRSKDVYLDGRISDLTTSTRDAFVKQQTDIVTLKSTYATKEYVNTQLVEFNSLHKEIVDAINFDNNTVIINGVEVPSKNNVIYLVRVTSDQEETYNQYTLIDDVLIFIGSSKIDLSGYATVTYVDEQIEAIPKVDLSEYAKLTDIPDVSEFIDEIPPEYVTEQELEDKKYLTSETAETDFATKIYVQSELAKIGTLAKEIIDGVDLVNNKILVDEQCVNPSPNVIYLVKIENSSDYAQYTVINNLLTYIGSTSVELTGYATVDYVNECIDKTISDVKNLLIDIDFIDGGTAADII